jgi:rubrerythrin
MHEDKEAAFEKEWKRAQMGARRVDIEPMYSLFKEAKRQEAEREAEKAYRQMRQARLWADLPHCGWKQLGDQSLVDVPTDVPLEKIILDELGQHHLRGEPWKCRKCGAQFQMGLPPDNCPVCKHPSIIKDKTLNLRR